MKNEVGTISAAEFAAAEQLLKDEDPEECRNEDVRGMLEVFEGLMNTEEAALPYGHTIDTYRRENSRMKELLQQGDALAQKPFMLNPWLEPEKSTLSGDTKLKSLLLRFSLLKDDLIAYNSKFSILNSPMAKVILPIATIKMMSEQSGIPRQELIDKINELIAVY